MDIFDNKSVWDFDTHGDFDYPPMEMVQSEVMQNLIIGLYTVTAAFSVTGNAIVIYVLMKGQRSSSELRIFLINLAASDLMMAAFSIPFTYTMFMLGRWVFPMPSVTCPLVMYLQHVSVFVSVYTLTAIGIDRYRAILYPLKRRASRCRSRLVLAVIWIAACVICSCIFVVTKATKIRYERVYHWDCGEQWGGDTHGAQLYTLAVLVVTFGVPMLFLAFTYSAVALHLWKRATPGNADPARDQMQLQATKKVLLMLVTIVLLFAVCWLPLQLFLVLYYFVPGFDQSGTENRPYYASIYLACHWLACANSCVNPIVYCFMSDNFLMDLKELLRNCGRSTNLRQRKQGGSSTSTRTTTLSLQHGRFQRRSSRALRELQRVASTNPQSANSDDTAVLQETSLCLTSNIVSGPTQV